MITENPTPAGAEPAATVTPIPAKRGRSRATRAADKTAASSGAAKKPAAAAKKPAPAKSAAPAQEELSHSAKRLITMNALVAAGAEVIQHWDAKGTGVTKEEARAFMANRLSYCGPKVDWPAKVLGPRGEAAGK
jgi:hypothetical protein